MPRPARWFDRTWGRRVAVAALAAIVVASTGMLVFLLVAGPPREPESAERLAQERADGGDPPRLWKAPSFSFLDQHRRPTTLASLRGEPFVADFIYTQCTSACPMLTSKMVMLQRRLTGQRVRFVSFSVDPAHDTPDALAAYAAKWNDAESRWALLATSDASLADVTSGFRVSTEKTHDEENPILHSNLFFLVDAEGFVRGVYSSIDQDAMDRLTSDVLRLTHGAPAADAPAPDSRDLYASLGCPGCHENPKLAPPLVNLRGAERMLQDGSRVTIDDAYLRRAIFDPGKDVVADYAAIMPSYRCVLSDAQLSALVAELDARTSADASAPPPDVAVMVDPVCRMKVRAVPEAPHVTFQGKEIYFCSEVCRDQFAKNPSHYPLDSLAGTKGSADP